MTYPNIGIKEIYTIDKDLDYGELTELIEKKIYGNLSDLLSYYYKPKKSRSPGQLDALEHYLLEVIQTDTESITPVVVGERVIYKPDGQLLSGFPQDVRAILTQLNEERIGDVNLRDVLWHWLSSKEYPMRMPIVDSRGGVAILVSNASNEGEPREELLYWNELIGKFYYNLFKRLRYFDGVELGREPVLRIGATTEDLKKALHDRYFSSLVTVGHGRYGVWGATDKAIDWAHVREYVLKAGHLKSGFWIHLTCLPPVEEEPLSGQIPFPYFAMRDTNNILGLQNKGDGLFYSEEFIGINGHQTVEPVMLRRIAHDSFLTKFEEWKKTLDIDPVSEALFNQAVELGQSSSSDPFNLRLAAFMLGRYIKRQLKLLSQLKYS